MSDRLLEIKDKRAKDGRIEDMDDEVADLVRDVDWLIAEIERLRRGC